jgi:hypothetical protein
MASPIATNLWTTYGLGYPGTAGVSGAIGAAGIRENVSDILTNVDPDDTPTVAILQKTTTNNLFSDWMIDALTATSTAAAAEGAEWAGATLFGRTRLQNWVQRFRKDFGLSQDQIELARRGGIIGVHDAMGHEATRAGKEIPRNINARLWSTFTGASGATSATAVAVDGAMGYATGAADTGSATATQMANLRWFGQYCRWVKPGINASGATGGVVVNVSGAFATAGFYQIQEAQWTAGIKADTLIVSGGVKLDLSRTLLNDTALGSVRNTDAIANGEYGPIIEILRTDLGRVACLVDRWMPQSTANATSYANQLWAAPAYALIEKSRVRLAYWRQLRPYSLPPSGDNMRAYMLAALTVEVTNPLAIGIGANVVVNH